MIAVEGLHKTFGEVTAVKGLSFCAPDGAITGLLGANGAGKTTTLRMIAGVLKPQGGQIRIDRERTGALLDHTGLYARLTVRENLAYFGRLRGIPAQQLGERIEELLAVLGLARMADRRTAGFSQGERMKTALARALIHSPHNLLLDEPTNGLDVPTVRALRAFLERMRGNGTCIVYSSHVLEEVRALCDNVVIIARGCVAAQGTAEELCRQSGNGSLEDAFVNLTEEADTCRA
jgi:sodium transport system ATP-binding protein